MYEIEGMVFLVTGGARGMGAATAELAASEGARVMIADVLDEEGEATAGRIRDAGGEAAYHRCDLADPAQISQLVAATAERFGGIDVLHNNAGINDAAIVPLDERPTVENLSLETWERVMAVNLRAPFLCTQAALPHLRRSERASIVNAASIASFMARPFNIAYAPSKAGVAQLTRTLAFELAADGIRVNAYAPGIVDTELATRRLSLARDPQAVKESILESYLVDEFGSPEDIARLVCFLASPRSWYINGVVWPIDGGFLAFKAGGGRN